MAKKPSNPKPFGQLYPSYYGYGKRDESKSSPEPEAGQPERVKVLEEVVAELRKQVDDLRKWRGVAVNTPVHQVSFDEFFNVDFNAGNLTVQFDSKEFQKQTANGGGGVGIAGIGSLAEWSSVVATGCVQDLEDEDCLIPWKITNTFQLFLEDGALTVVTALALMTFDNECKYLKCGGGASYTPVPPGSYTSDRWRLCGLSQGGGTQTGDFLLPAAVYDGAVLVGRPIIKFNEAGSCYNMIARLVNEAPQIITGIQYCDECDDLGCCVPPPVDGGSCNCAPCYHIEDSSTGDFLELGVGGDSCIYDNEILGNDWALAVGSAGLYLASDNYWYVVAIEKGDGTDPADFVASFKKDTEGGCPNGTYNLYATSSGTPPPFVTVTAACEPPSCTCADNTEPATLTVDQSGMTVQCNDCTTGAIEPWDGELALTAPGSCQWLMTAGSNTSSFGTTAVRNFGVSIELINPGGGADCYWRLVMNCTAGAYKWFVGKKEFGPSPVGTYTKDNTFTQCAESPDTVDVT